MKLLTLSTALSALSLLTYGQQTFSNIERHFVNKDIVKEIKGLNTTWVPFEAEKNPFKNRTDEEIQSMFGLRTETHSSIFGHLFSRTYNSVHSIYGNEKTPSNKKLKQIVLPDSFDSRTVWPVCIHPVRDQGYCGACWAFASAGFLQDRFCIASNEVIRVTLAPQDMVTCDLANGGCGGGWLTASLNFLVSDGLVTEECMPYSQEVGYCTYQCTDSTVSFKKHYCKIGSVTVLTDIEDIKAELFTNGPMMVGLSVYTDFLSYSSGIYEHVAGRLEGGHAVKLIGWDKDADGRLYWICQNQWDTNWGENGFFNVYSGEIGLDSAAWSCLPDID